MPSEKYQPSAEEIKQAEDSMTSAQMNLSNARAWSAEELKKNGVTGYLEVVLGQTPPAVMGMINGHTIQLVANPEGEFEGRVDNTIELDPTECRNFLKRYDYALARHKPDIFEEAKDVEGKSKASILKAIGL